MAARRKRRTHVKPVEGDEASRAPKSFVIRSGSLSRLAQKLQADIRKVLEPNTASRLKERKRNKLRDFIGMAGPLNVSHIMILSQTSSSLNLRIGKFPQGPTLFFQVLQYSLIKDIKNLQKRPHSPGIEYHNAPLLVLNNLPMDTSHGKLLCSMLQNMFPAINTQKVKLADVRRVALFDYNKEEDSLEFRHYLITTKTIGLSKSIKRLVVRSEIPNLGNFADAADYVLKAEANLSDSEVEADSIVTLGQDYLGKDHVKSQQKSINLQEIGPRMTLRLAKVVEGLNKGTVLYDAPNNRTVSKQVDQSEKPEVNDQ